MDEIKGIDRSKKTQGYRNFTGTGRNRRRLHAHRMVTCSLLLLLKQYFEIFYKIINKSIDNFKKMIII